MYAAYLRDGLEGLLAYPNRRIGELLPRLWQPEGWSNALRAMTLSRTEGGALAALEVAMDRNLARDRTTLGDEILKCYVRAGRERQPKVAEQLLRALEELARSDPARRAALDEAYLLIGRCSRIKM